jgi:hypothetical protein
MPERTSVGTRAEVVAEALSATSGEVLVVCSRAAVVEAIVAAEASADLPEFVRLLVDETTARDVQRDFLTASRVVDLVEAGGLEVRTVADDDLPLPALFVASDRVVNVLPTGDGDEAAFVTSDETVLETLRDSYTAAWDETDEFTFRTPAYSMLLETLGDDVRDDMATVLDLDATEAALDGGLDEVDVAVLVAAKNGEELYEISRWGERIRLASPAKFSQAKQRLEEADLIDTEKIPQDRGRPRQRLVLGAAMPADPGLEDLITTARETLSAS